ncbi:MAG: hypothetical protein M3063_15705 [Actinomycetota bacterium]|nr:hypothetical protein [Actinomycetota bacterium]
MTALVVIVAVAAALVVTVVVDGLRLHASVLRRLHHLDPAGGTEWESTEAGRADRAGP